MADLFVSYQAKIGEGAMSFGCCTLGNIGEPRTMDAVEQLRLFIQSDLQSRGNPSPSVVILWWKELGQ
ncbi:hypothetical protein TSH7_01385 [Azospirillum sp. TSH7]|uniref:hypothetical protein n=1 Tax=unclassified Azospirillum TaxID=2630922 RepID=UPI000D60CA86|nr:MULTISPECIES: hypothetical protein [unclassified Azospirillum]PWC69125.1 hypothetical protein TSH7_01385 [Azospirillum sp. TSH7]PWC71383.1 hypothetical protein TSH20_03690 [Azospirillum sp. TSH20]